MQSLAVSATKRLALLARINAMRLKIAGRRLAKQTAFIALALLLGVGGVGMLMLCLFTLLAEAFGLVVGALATGAVLLAMAGGAVVMAARQDQNEAVLVLDSLEETVIKDLTTDFAEVENGIRRLQIGSRALFKGDYLKAFANLADVFE